MIVVGLHDGPPTPFTVTNSTISASTHVIAWVRQAKNADAISAVHFLYGVRTGTPPTFSVSIETVNTSGNPSGTDAGGGSPTLVTFTPPASTAWNSLIQTVTLTNSWTPTAGQLFAIVIRYSSGTINGSNCSSFAVTSSGHDPSTRGFPYYATSTDGSAYTKAGAGLIAWTAGGTVVGHVMQSIYSTATANTNGHRSAGYFTLPASMGDTYDLCGVDIAGKVAAAGATCTLKLWDTSWNVLASISLDGDTASQPGTYYSARQLFFDSPYTASFGTKYYVGFECDGSATVGVTGITCSSTGQVAAYPNGENMGIVTWNGSTTTESNLTLPCMNLLIDNITGGTGGGLLSAPGMTGGMR